MSGDSVGLSWNQARYNIRHQDGKNYESVSQALVPEIKNDSDGKVEIKFGTALWDYAEALKDLSTDLKGVDTNTVIQKINNAQKNPFADVDAIPAGATLDLSSFIKPGDSKDDKPADKPDAKKEQISKALDYLSDCENFNEYKDRTPETCSGIERISGDELAMAIKDANDFGDKDLAAGLEQIKKDLAPISNQAASNNPDDDKESDWEASINDFQTAKEKLDGGESYEDIVKDGNKTIRNLDAKHYGSDDSGDCYTSC